MLNWIKPTYPTKPYLREPQAINRALLVIDLALKQVGTGKIGTLNLNTMSVDEISAKGLEWLLLVAMGGAEGRAKTLKENSGIEALHQNWRPFGETYLSTNTNRNAVAFMIAPTAAAATAVANHYGAGLVNPAGVTKSLFNQGKEFYDQVGPKDLIRVRYENRFQCNCGSREVSAGVESTDCTRAIDSLNSARGFKKTLGMGSSALSLALAFVAPGSGLAVAAAKETAAAAADYRKACFNQRGDYTGNTDRGSNRSAIFDDVEICTRASKDPDKCPKIYLVKEKDTNDWFITPNENALWLGNWRRQTCTADGCQKTFGSTRTPALWRFASGTESRHHCRACGGIFCDDHTTLRLPVVEAITPFQETPSAARRQKLLDGFFQENHAETSRDAIYSREDQAHLQIYENQRVCVDCYTLARQQKVALSSGLNTAENNVRTLTDNAHRGCKKAQAALLTIFHGNFAYVFASLHGKDRVSRIKDEIGA